jgi:uncharacterized protein (TIGR03067 family)
MGSITQGGVPTEAETKQRPDPAQPEILLVFKGLRVIGLPFREPESIGFDEVSQWRSQIYDLGEGGKKTLTRRQSSHNVTRYSLSLKSGVWLVSGTMLSNGVHDGMGKSAFQGIVKWHADGFQLVGNIGIQHYYAAGGKLILGTGHGSTRYLRQGDHLVLKSRFQSYHLAADPEENILTVPDFKRPFGSPFVVEYKSEAVETNFGKDLEQFQGAWVRVSKELNGEKLQVTKTIITFNGDKFETVTDGKAVESGTVKVDSSKKPKTYSATITGQFAEKGDTYNGIYEVNGDRLTTCVNTNEGKEAPSEFASKAGTGHQLIVWKRVKISR